MSLTDDSGPQNPSAPHRSRRDRPAKAPLSEAAILDAALAILRAEGLDAVSMRRVAGALDTGAASLYVYVANHDALLQGVLDRIIADVELEVPDPDRWREQLHSLLQRLRQALGAHPGIAALTLADPPPTEPVLLLIENLMGIVLASGVEPQDAAWACDVFPMLVTAGVIEEDDRRARGMADNGYQDQVEQLHATFVALPPDRFPALTAHATEMVTGDGDARFRFAIDVVIEGIVARAARQPGGG
jgi:AcrR family transcriptional regulator